MQDLLPAPRPAFDAPYFDHRGRHWGIRFSDGSILDHWRGTGQLAEVKQRFNLIKEDYKPGTLEVVYTMDGDHWMSCFIN